MNINQFPSLDKFNEELIIRIGKIADENNFEVYAVGGYVRDRILGRERKEIDLLVVGDGTKFARIVSKELKTEDIVIYRNFGTALIKFGEYKIEFVGSRRESYTKYSRKPIVEAGSFEDDIRRRDFTINTLAFSINSKNFGEIIDLFNGFEDIKNKIIKTPLDPYITFSDDPLRIMRAFRFAAQLKFQIEENTLKAAEEMRERLAIVSTERIVDEFFKIMMSDKPSIGLALMYQTKVLEFLYPEIANMAGVEQRKDYHHKDVFWHTLEVVDNVAERSNDLWLRLAALFHDIAKPLTKAYNEKVGWTFHGHEELGARMIRKLFMKYKFPLHKVGYIEKLIRLHLRPIALIDENVTDSAIRRLIVAAGEDLEDLITLCRCDITSKNPEKVKTYQKNYDLVVQKIHDVIERDKLRAFQSPVRGDEIMKIFNLPPCKGVGIIKERIENAILDGEIPNTYEAALNYINEHFDELNREVEIYRNNQESSS
ncbi:MAG: CCA tRNA nucleotidyltransferase [Ignavibacteria bacterium]|jgi:putative nucleotidyltransferase with HDIG domain|nr:CCA tRNA nucleotidyltransferase [Ignavibacteria bacterium]MDH7527586.1 CCA tRNA nucleotidyltransferase [Ignavibacteria bacterium]